MKDLICPGCGSRLPYEGAQCTTCGYHGINKAGAGCLAAIAGPLLKLLKGFGILLIISAVIWGILFFVFDTYKIDYTVVGESSRTAEEFEAFLLDFDGKREAWEIQYDRRKNGTLGRLSSDGSYTIRYNKGETAAHTTFVFEGESLGTGLSDGTYILTSLDGADVLINGNEKLIYKEDSEFYKTYAPKLQAITHDALLTEILASTEGGEHGLVETDPPTEAIFTKSAAVTARLVRNDADALMDHGFEARLNTDGDAWDVYKFTYYYANSVRDLDTDGYTYAE